MKKKGILLLLLLLVAASGTAWYIIVKRRHKPTPWRYAVVERGDIETKVTATGSISPLTMVQVGTQVSGTIARLYADFNSNVHAGQIIALLDTTFLVASRNEARAALERAQIQLKQSGADYERTKRLFDSSAVSQQEFENALTNFESAQSALSSATAVFERTKINLEYAIIRAPISGVVISRNVDVGQTVVASFNAPTLFTIANNLTRMQVYANVDEADIGNIRVGQNAVFTVDAYPGRRFTGMVQQVRLQPNLVQNVVNYTVIMDVENPDMKLLPGLTANISVQVIKHPRVLKVTTSALHFVPPANAVRRADVLQMARRNALNPGTGDTVLIWRRSGDSLYASMVVVGILEGGFAEIAGDVGAGDSLVSGVTSTVQLTQTRSPFMPSMRRQKK